MCVLVSVSLCMRSESLSAPVDSFVFGRSSLKTDTAPPAPLIWFPHSEAEDDRPLPPASSPLATSNHKYFARHFNKGLFAPIG